MLRQFRCPSFSEINEATSVEILTIANATITRGASEAFSAHLSHLTLNQGEVLSILGPSGCGKSTLLDVIGLVLRPRTAERFELDFGRSTLHQTVHKMGERELKSIRRRHFGYVLQSGGLIGCLTVRENILTSVRFSGTTLDKSRYSHLIGSLEIGDLLARKPRELSGGQRQRVAIARALVHGPRLVLADEPTAAVDHALAEDVCRALRSCAKEMDAAVAMVTHNRELADAFSDRIIDLGHRASSPLSKL